MMVNSSQSCEDLLFITCLDKFIYFSVHKLYIPYKSSVINLFEVHVLSIIYTVYCQNSYIFNRSQIFLNIMKIVKL